jgi:long-chain acyl-CoA synthetase
MVAALAGDLGIPDVVCLGQDITVPQLVAEAKAAAGLRTASPADPAALLFSGGTTGLPKTVEHTHGRLVTAVRCAEYIWPTRTDGEVFPPIAPFSHIYGFILRLLVPLSARGVLRDNQGENTYCLTGECSRDVKRCLTKRAPVASLILRPSRSSFSGL